MPIGATVNLTLMWVWFAIGFATDSLAVMTPAIIVSGIAALYFTHKGI